MHDPEAINEGRLSYPSGHAAETMVRALRGHAYMAYQPTAHSPAAARLSMHGS